QAQARVAFAFVSTEERCCASIHISALPEQARAAPIDALPVRERAWTKEPRRAVRLTVSGDGRTSWLALVHPDRPRAPVEFPTPDDLGPLSTAGIEALDPLP